MDQAGGGESRRRDAASLAVFRIVFGALMLVELGRYAAYGWIEAHYVEPRFFFHYPFFEWVAPASGWLLWAHFALMAVAAACITVGFRTRIAALVFAFLFAWWFLSDRTRYLNHFYLITILAFLLVVIPSDRVLSVDARSRPHPKDETVPAWALWLLRFQIGVPYFFGGIAKLNADWLAGEPMRMWLAQRTDLPVLGAFFAEEWCVRLFALGGLAFDLLVVPALLWKRTRPFAFAAAVTFHLLNAAVFWIGIFPWLMIGATTIFFEPDWPRRIGLLKRRTDPTNAPAHDSCAPTTVRKAVAFALVAWVSFQCLFPLRHFAYPGDVSWTEEGHLFAWHMKLRDKAGAAHFFAVEPATGKWRQIELSDHLTEKQVSETIRNPDMIAQFARYLSRACAVEGAPPPEIRAHVFLALNGRAPQLLVDPEVDLASAEITSGRDWILPLTEPLPRP